MNFGILINATDADHLNLMLDVLEKRGLLKNSPAVSINQLSDAPEKKPRGQYLVELSEKSNARLAELGFTKRPLITDEERALRITIDAERVANGLKGVNWKFDLVEREKALASKGYDIYSYMPEDTGIPKEEETTDYKIDLENPVV